MKKLMCLFLATRVFSSAAQVPDYVSNEGLVAWYAFDGDATNAVSVDGEGEVFSVGYGEDRFGNAEGALAIINSESSVSLDLEAFAEGNAPRTISYWLKRADNANEDEPFTGVIYNAQGCMRKSFACGANIYTKGVSVDFSCGAVTFEHASTHEECGWNHVVVVVPSMEDPKIGNVLVYENGELLNLLEGTAISEDFETIHGEYRIGGSFFENWGDNLFDLADQECGAPMIDDLAFYQRDLSSDEVLELYLSGPPVFGCTDASACNFDASANVEDGSCLDCDLFANRCLDGTIWSEELQGCVVANPSDTDFDSCVGMTDLLNLLSVFGTCAEPELAEWTCGEPVGYQGYNYSTVLIGEQCWFAENLRTESYANGDEIASQLSESDWDGATAGATAVYGDVDLTCYDYAPDLDACGPGQSLSTFGRVYNWHSLVDDRGLCPTGWQVPSDLDWSVMEQAVGMAPGEAESSGWRGTNEGTQLKSQIGWSSGNGTDNWSFNGLPAGHRHHSGNYFDAAGNAALFWTATEFDSERAWFRILSHSESRIQRTPDFKTYGCSVRCIKDLQ